MFAERSFEDLEKKPLPRFDSNTVRNPLHVVGVES